MASNDAKGPLGLRLIGGFKVICALLLIGLGVGLFRNVHADPAEQAGHLVSALKLDPDNHFIHGAIEKVSGISPKQLKELAVGTFLYALLYLVEGVGLLMRKHWAEYFTVVATGALIPVEIYEVWQRLTPIRVAILVLNVAIVAYLVYNLRRSEKPVPAD